MIYASALFFLISIFTFFTGASDSSSVSSVSSNLMASAFLVISIFFLALRYWNKAEDNGFLSEY